MIPIRSFPALLLRNELERILVIADLHIGWELELAQKGIHIPPQMPKIRDRIIQLIESNNPTKLILLGDVKHTIATAKFGEWRDVPDFFEAISRLVKDIWVIPGNHDGNLSPLLPNNVEIQPSRGVVLWGNIGLFHGHSWPALELLEASNLVMGHVHPIVTLRNSLGFRVTRQVWVKAKCDSAHLAGSVLKNLKFKVADDPADSLRKNFNVELKASNLFIMPSFNDYLGGRPMNRRRVGKNQRIKAFINPVLQSKSTFFDDAELYLLDGTFLGSVSQLRTLA